MHSFRISLLALTVVSVAVGGPSLATAADEKPRAGLDLYGDPLPPGAVARLGSSRFRGGLRYCAVAFSPDGKTIASLNDEASITLWNAASGKRIFSEPFPETGAGVRSPSSQFHNVLAFSPDGKTLLVGWDWIGKSRPLCLWDVAARKERLRLEGGAAGFFSAVVSADFHTLAAADAEGRVQLWNLASGKPAAHWTPPNVKSQLVALSPDGRIVATAGEDKTVRLWDADSGKPIRAFAARKQPLAALAFAPDGRTLACEDKAERVVLYNLAGQVDKEWVVEGQAYPTSFTNDYDGPLHPMSFSPDGRTLVLWDKDGSPALWDATTGKRRGSITADPVHAWAFSRDGKTLAVAGNSFLALFDAVSGVPLYPSHDYEVSQIRFSADGRNVVTFAGNKVRRWDAATGRLLRIIWTDQNSLLSADGRAVFSKGRWGTNLTINDTATDDPRKEYVVEGAGEYLMAVSPDQQTLATASTDTQRGFRLVNLVAAGPTRMLGAIDPYANFACFSPDGRQLAVTGPVPAPPDRNRELRSGDAGAGVEEKGQCLVWNVASGTLRCRLPYGCQWHSSGDMAFSPDGRLLALRDKRGRVHLCETATGKEIRNWETKSGSSLAFSPDGRTLSVSDWPGGPVFPIGTDQPPSPSVSLWDVDDGRRLGWLTGPGQLALTFSPDGRRLVSADGAGACLVCDVAVYTRRQPPPATHLSQEELAGLWENLGGADAKRAFEAVGRLARAPEDTTTFLQARREERQAKASAARLSRLIAALDEDAMATREKAIKDLIEIADLAAPTLRERLKDKDLSPEVHQNIMRVLEAMNGTKAAPQLQWLRATAVLERIATPGARNLLAKLAAADGPAAVEATWALRRLRHEVNADQPPIKVKGQLETKSSGKKTVQVK